MNRQLIRGFIHISSGSVALALLTALVFFGSAGAQAGTSVSFGIRPTEAILERPETFSYFSYELLPGVTISDAALVLNDGDVPVDLKLYAADGMTNQNGGVGFALYGQSSTGRSRGVDAWVVPSVDEIHLEPGEERVVPFTITVPLDAGPGHHVAGLVVEAPPGSANVGPGNNDADFAVNIVQRVGVAVVVEVPGMKVFALEIDGVGLDSDNEAGTTFLISVHNTGNMYLKGSGVLELSDSSGLLLLSIPFEMDTILPRDSIIINVTHSSPLVDGAYLISVVLDYEAGSATLENAPFLVRDGQLVDDGSDLEPLPDVEPDPGSDGGWTDSRYILFAVGMFALAGAVAVLLFFIGRRMARE